MWMFLDERPYMVIRFKPQTKINRTRIYCIPSFCTRTVLEISKDILFKTLIVCLKFNFILYLDKQLHEVITCDVVPLPVVHTFFYHITKIFWNVGVKRLNFNTINKLGKVDATNNVIEFLTERVNIFLPHCRNSASGFFRQLHCIPKKQDDVISVLYLVKISFISIVS
jgi:hypothetical protein